jgi:signal transduction histidine kinase
MEFSAGSAFKSSNGRLYFGGSRGLSFFLPDRIELNLTPPAVVLTGLRIFNRPAIPGDPGSPLQKSLQDTREIVLSFKESMFTIEFAALNYLLPQKNQYTYKLEGLDPEWKEVGGHRSATYMNVLPGEYTFRVRAANNDGVWNEQGATLKIRVTPPFWATLWFRALVITVLGAGLYSWYAGKMRAATARRRELEALVKQRTADLEAEIGQHKRTEEQLIEAAATLEERNAELQSFADVASHDLQEPLRKVRGLAEILDTSWESMSRAEIADVHHRMQSAAGRMQALIAQLLAYARLGKVEPQLVPLDMSALVREVLGDLEARIEQTGGCVEVGTLPAVHADPVQLRQLTQNLVGNALKFARPGARPVVRVYMTGETVAADGADGPRCEIAVSDNGIGFEQAEADRVFRPFYRLHTRQQYEGTGLGLAICHKIVDRHKGTIRAVSAPGLGTTFFFTLALAAEGSPEAKSA